VIDNNAGEGLREAAKAAVERLAHVSMDIDLMEWSKLSADILAAIGVETYRAGAFLTPPSDAGSAMREGGEGMGGRPSGSALAERISAAVTYVRMPMQVRKLLVEATTVLTANFSLGALSDGRGGRIGDLICVVRRPASFRHGWSAHTAVCRQSIVEGYLRTGYQFDWLATNAARAFATTPSPDASPDSGEAREAYARALFSQRYPREEWEIAKGHGPYSDMPDAVSACYADADAILAAPSPSPAIVKEAGEVERLRQALDRLELTDDDAALRVPYAGDADDHGREIIVGGDVVVSFADSDEGEAVRDAILPLMTPYQRGVEAARRGDPAPAFPTPDSSWSDRLFNRGWEDETAALSASNAAQVVK